MGLTKNFQLFFVVHKVQSIVYVAYPLALVLLHHLQIFAAIVVKQVKVQLINFEDLLQQVFVDLREVSVEDFVDVSLDKQKSKRFHLLWNQRARVVLRGPIRNLLFFYFGHFVQ